jgi:hypothetical protein
MGMFISQLGMAETKKSEANYNGIHKRSGLQNHPVRTILCGCGPDCGAFHLSDKTVDISKIKLNKVDKIIYDECHHFK